MSGTESPVDARRKLRERAQTLREEAAALERQADGIAVPIPKPRKTKAQLEKELEDERARRREAESALRHATREPDYSYFGIGDGPT